MKHLKKYKLFESSNIENEIKDLLTELEDLNFIYRLNKFDGSTIDSPCTVFFIMKTGRNRLFKISETQDFILRLIDIFKNNMKIVLHGNDNGAIFTIVNDETTNTILTVNHNGKEIKMENWRNLQKLIVISIKYDT